jgi:hypothetical protein
MRGLDVMMPSLQSRIGDGTVAPTPISLLQGTSDVLAGVELQQRIEELARAVGASLTSTESLATDAAGNYHRIGLRVTLSAPWPVFIRFLVAIRQTTPLILVDDLTLSTSRTRGADEGSMLNGRLTVLAFAAEREVGRRGDLPTPPPPAAGGKPAGR